MISTCIIILPGLFALIEESQGQTAHQPLTSQSVPQGEALLLYCTYNSSGSPYLFWYVQYNNKAPEMMLYNFGQKQHLGFTAKQEQRESSFHLRKGEAEVTDSGEYYCAVRDTVIKTCSSPVI
ncbi:hypothetical protein FKM82_025910 [Ascaphus truei]